MIVVGCCWSTSRSIEFVLALEWMWYMCVDIDVGLLVTVETLSHHFSGGDDYHPSVVRPNKTFWKEMPQADKRIIFFVRLFSVTGQGSSSSPEAIGVLSLYLINKLIH